MKLGHDSIEMLKMDFEELRGLEKDGIIEKLKKEKALVEKIAKKSPVYKLALQKYGVAVETDKKPVEQEREKDQVWFTSKFQEE